MDFEYPKIIQGGMGVAISNWHLAKTVSKLGQLGVVSGVALEVLLVRRLQDGDVGGHIRRALENFPFRDMAKRAVDKYYIQGGKAADKPYATIPMHQQVASQRLHELCILGNFVEVFLAREGHDRPVGINYLEKIQMPHMASAYGAMLAGVAYVVMGAGIPTMMPGVLDGLSQQNVYLSRTRICDLGYLRELYRKDDGRLGYRCASEPVEIYVAKSGIESDTIGRKCICNSLVANAGYPQIQKGGVAERPLLTSGDDLTEIARFIPEGQTSYTARDVINKLLEIES